MAVACYAGPDPIKDNEKARIRVWKWAKANGIDKGLSFDQVHEAINKRFYGGMAKPEWIADILSGRKTPFREISNELWRAQYNRRQIIQQAQDQSRFYGMGSFTRALKTVYDLPRSGLVFAHGLAFPAVHAGRLSMQPLRWGKYLRSIYESWRSLPPGSGAIFNERLMSTIIKGNKNYDLYLRAGLDMKSIMQSQPEYMARIPGLGAINKWSHEMGVRGWNALLALRFRLMDDQFKFYEKPGMTNAERLELAKSLAPGANHATGSARIPIAPKYAGAPGHLLFGPKLLASKLASLTTDPAKALSIAAKAAVGKATYAERAGLYSALSGSTQWIIGTLGTLALNTAYNQFKGGAKVNMFDDPTRSDWLKYKVGGMEFEAPGLLPEIREVGKQIAIQLMNPKTIKDHFYGQTTKGGAFWKAFWDDWLKYKLHPSITTALDLKAGLSGENVPPWYAGADKKMDWLKYGLSKTPISSSGMLGYFYDQLKKGGLTDNQASTIIHGAIMFGLGMHGIPIREETAKETKKQQHRAHVAAQLRAR